MDNYQDNTKVDTSIIIYSFITTLLVGYLSLDTATSPVDGQDFFIVIPFFIFNLIFALITLSIADKKYTPELLLSAALMYSIIMPYILGFILYLYIKLGTFFEMTSYILAVLLISTTFFIRPYLDLFKTLTQKKKIIFLTSISALLLILDIIFYNKFF